jgi:two-component system chemotaxis response regulator CheB
MPASAQRNVAIDHCLPLEKIPPVLASLARMTPGPAVAAGADDLIVENRWMRGEPMEMERLEAVGTPTSLTCPECHGPLWEAHDSAVLRYRCRTGHAFTAESMLAEQALALEGALWMALNTLEESALVSDRLAADAVRRGHRHVTARFTEKAEESRRRAATIRQAILTAQAAAGIDEEAAAVVTHEADRD